MGIKQYATMNASENHSQITCEQSKQNPLQSDAFCMYSIMGECEFVRH